MTEKHIHFIYYILIKTSNTVIVRRFVLTICVTWPPDYIKGKLSDSFTNYNYVGNTKVSVSIKKT